MDAFEVALAPLIITVIMLAAVVHSIFKEVHHEAANIKASR